MGFEHEDKKNPSFRLVGERDAERSPDSYREQGESTNAAMTLSHRYRKLLFIFFYTHALGIKHTQQAAFHMVVVNRV